VKTLTYTQVAHLRGNGMNKPNSSRRRRRILTTAIAAAIPVFALTSISAAQQRINANGRVLDANNRVGSGGQNPDDSRGRSPQNALGNDIVTGNVTGGKHFRGPIDYTDPNAFRGQTAGINMDNFLRQSSGPTQDSRLADTTVRFYGEGRAAPPPPNFVEVGGLGSGSYVPGAPAVNRSVADQRVGAVDFSQPYVLPAPGQLLLPGPVDPSAGQQFITASPLTGIRQINANDPNFFNSVSHTQYNPATGRLDDNAIQRMREELNAAAGASDPGSVKTVTPTDAAGGAGGADGTGAEAKPGAQRVLPPGPGAVRVEQQPILPPDTGAVQIEQKPISEPIAQTPNQLGTGQSVRNRITTLVKPEEQSTIYAQLRRRHEEAAADQSMSDADAARAFNVARRAEEEAKKTAGQPGQPGQPGGVGAPGQPGALPGQPGAPVPGRAQPGGLAAAPGAAPIPQPPGPGDAPAPGIVDYTKRNEELMKQSAAEKKKQRKVYAPVKVPSLATGVKGKGLADVLKNAENLMKEGKFTSALDQYDAAEQVAPNNPLTRLGRANAELGAAYYARAEAHLRDVFQKNPELLAGQYDLTNMLGEQRMQVLVKDLKEIANRDQKEARPVFLLAYIAYNTGHEQNAEAYLDLADKRSGGKDPFFQLLRDNWALPAAAAAAPTTAPAPDLGNK
jgi:tetratricopeptide (TPR) repeat protein